MKLPSIAIIGAGAVGTTAAYAIMLKKIPAHITLIDIDEQRCKGETFDLQDAASFDHFTHIKNGTPKDAQQSDIIIIAAGIRQKPGQSRIELIDTNKKIIASIIKQIIPIQEKAIVIMISNPLDLLTLQAQKELNIAQNRIFGTGTFLDTQRLRAALAHTLNVSSTSIHAYILGEHGDTQFPAWSQAQIDGIPILQFPKITEQKLDEIAHNTRQRAYDIIACKGATFYGIGTCVATLCEIIILDKKYIVPLSCFIEQLNICLSVPVILGKNGIEKKIDTLLNNKEQQQLALSAQQLQKMAKEYFN